MSAQARPLFEFPLRTRLFIDGAWCVPETKQRLPVVNPSTEETIVEVEAGGRADVDRAVRAASHAFRAWKQRSGAQRAAFLRAIARGVEAHCEHLAALQSLNNGKPIRLSGKHLVIPPQLMFQAEVILNSALRSGTANNDLNAIKSMGMLPGGFKVVTRLTSSTNWWIQTDAQEGLKHMVRRKLQKSMEGDFDTDNMRYKSTERYGFGWTDPRCLYGTPGP